MTPRRPELLAPARDRAALRAAVDAGADAVYFGLAEGFNARARAPNLALEELPEVMGYLHERNRRGYLALNTLVFDSELDRVESILAAAALASVDALIVQDLGVARLAQKAAPQLRLHASTQMTLTNPAAIQLANQLGFRRVVLPRELSRSEVAVLRAASGVELELFVHGALCISYSGQCLASQVLGQRSANRGVCGQACRLPYRLLVDGQPRTVDSGNHLLSPHDLDLSRMLAEIVRVGVDALKIEGRLKGPEYVAATTLLYRRALDVILEGHTVSEDRNRARAASFYSRGAGPGYWNGVKHHELVDPLTSDHVGIPIGSLLGIHRTKGRQWLRLQLNVPLELGDGILVPEGRVGTDELGGRVWALRRTDSRAKNAGESHTVMVWLGPEKANLCCPEGARVFRSSSRNQRRELRQELPASPARGQVVATVSGSLGQPVWLELAHGPNHAVRVRVLDTLQTAQRYACDQQAIRECLGRLGETPFELRQCTIDLPDHAHLPLSAVNQARRNAVAQLGALLRRPQPSPPETSRVPLDIPLASTPPPPGLWVLCSTLDQARVAAAEGVDGLLVEVPHPDDARGWLSLLRMDFRGPVGIALPRIASFSGLNVAAFLKAVRPELLLIRSLGSLAEYGAQTEWKHRVVGDFGLNPCNSVAVAELLGRGLCAFTPAFELFSHRPSTWLSPGLAPFCEWVVYGAPPLFHTRFCLYAAHLSPSGSKCASNQPCQRHALTLMDRKGQLLPVRVDVNCNNTVLGSPQWHLKWAGTLWAQGVRRYRIEFHGEAAAQARQVIAECRTALRLAAEPLPCGD